jgi:zinc and cadmium transporter
MLSTLTWILLVTILNGFVALLGAFIFLLINKKSHKSLIYFVSFTTGALLGGAFIHFIPEAAAELSLLKTTLLTLTGFVIFFLLETYLHWHHCHTHECDEHNHSHNNEKPYAQLLLYGDSIHNFIDGVIIAGSFIISVPLGIITSILIIAHELPQEISDFAVLIYGGFSKKKALIYNFLSQLTAVLGGLLGYFFIGVREQAIYLLPLAAGGFLHIAISDLIPEIFKEKDPLKRITNMLIIIAGILVLLSAKVLAE